MREPYPRTGRAEKRIISTSCDPAGAWCHHEGGQQTAGTRHQTLAGDCQCCGLCGVSWWVLWICRTIVECMELAGHATLMLHSYACCRHTGVVAHHQPAQAPTATRGHAGSRTGSQQQHHVPASHTAPRCPAPARCVGWAPAPTKHDTTAQGWDVHQGADVCCMLQGNSSHMPLAQSWQQGCTAACWQRSLQANLLQLCTCR